MTGRRSSFCTKCIGASIASILSAIFIVFIAGQTSIGAVKPSVWGTLSPMYPQKMKCSKLTSLYGSWTDVDGSQRRKAHTGVDGGRLGEWILAPADGTVKAVWRANWGWGWEGALLIRHTRANVNLKRGSPYYYSEFDHIKYPEVQHFKVGDRIQRGQRIARVHRPGGKTRYLPEVHWEVWEVWRDKLFWKKNRYGAPVWVNKRARLINPLSVMGKTIKIANASHVRIIPHAACSQDAPCQGFTYILPCLNR